MSGVFIIIVLPNPMLSLDGSLSPAQLMAVKLMEYCTLCVRTMFHGGVGVEISTGWYGGEGEMEMV